ncbi:MAG TPA: hypothetical protein VGX23_37865 [Actinocrinis sp.]|nr:hypothetical protein [Actinocrinis sp.]
MRIDSKFFVLFLAVLTILLCFLMLWLWRRLSRPGPAAVLGRIGLLVGSQLAMTATILAAVNIYFGFYTSWSDLLGNGTQSFQLYLKPSATGHGLNSGQLTGTGPTQSLHGLRSGIDANVTVYVPPGYQDPAQQHTRYPTIVVDVTGQDRPLPRGFARHAMNVPALLVYVDSGNAPAIPCTDVAGVAGQQGALFWDQDLRSAIAARYRVDQGPENWGVVGLDETAACAGTLAVLSSDYYGAAATLGPWTEPAGSPDPPAAAVTPEEWLKLYPGPPSSILLVGADEQTRQIFAGDAGQLQVTDQTSLDLDQMVSWLVQVVSRAGQSRWA